MLPKPAIDAVQLAQLCALVACFFWHQSACAQAILPPAPDAIGGGNPFQGLGRSDDPSPARYQDFAKNNLQDSSSKSGGAFSSDLVKQSTLGQDTPDSGNSSADGNLEKVLGDGLKSIGGLGGSETEGTSAEPINFGDDGSRQSNPPVFSDQPPESVLDSSSALDSGPKKTNSSNRDSSSAGQLSAEGSRDGLPPEPPGQSGLKTTNLSTPIKVTDLSSPPAKPEPKRKLTDKDSSVNPSAEGATAGGAIKTDGRQEPGAPGQVRLNRKASPMSSRVSDRIRQELERRTQAPRTSKSEHVPTQLQMVPAPPPMADALPTEPTGPTPERQALGLIHRGNYHQAERQLRDFVSSEPNNLHARYLFAVALVFNKKYDEAKTNYGIIIRKADDKRLVELAETGLHKLLH
jgi:hypothetical protein